MLLPICVKSYICDPYAPIEELLAWAQVKQRWDLLDKLFTFRFLNVVASRTEPTSRLRDDLLEAVRCEEAPVEFRAKWDVLLDLILKADCRWREDARSEAEIANFDLTDRKKEKTWT